MGVAALVLGIIAMVIGWTGIGIIPGVIALILGIIAFVKKKDKKGLIGAILGVIGALTFLFAYLACSSCISSVVDESMIATTPEVSGTPKTTTSYDTGVEEMSDVDVDELIGDIFGNKDKEDKKEKEEEEEEGKVKKNKDGKKYHVGDVIEGENWILTYVSCGDFPPDNQFYEAKADKKLVYVDVEVENKSGRDQIVASTSFTCYADGYECDWYCSKEDLSANISDGRKATGKAVFEVPKDAKTIEYEFDDDLWKDKKIILVVKE